MSKKVLIISTSPRKNGNSHILAEEFQKGAALAGHDTELISPRDKKLNFCQGCLACTKLGRCVIDDDANQIVAKMKDADVIVWATPVYYYDMSGQMKTMIDRANALYNLDYAIRDVYLLASAAEEEESAVDGTINGLNGWIACLEKTRLCGVVRGVGAEDPGDIKNQKDIMEAAFNMGKAV